MTRKYTKQIELSKKEFEDLAIDLGVMVRSIKMRLYSGRSLEWIIEYYTKKKAKKDKEKDYTPRINWRKGETAYFDLEGNQYKIIKDRLIKK